MAHDKHLTSRKMIEHQLESFSLVWQEHLRMWFGRVNLSSGAMHYKAQSIIADYLLHHKAVSQAIFRKTFAEKL
jgi:hypothetical protein